MKIGIVGLGFMGKMHLDCYKQMNDIEIIGVADAIPEKVDKFSRLYNCRGFNDPFHLICDKEIEMIDICTPTHTHKEFVIAAAEERKHVFCENPIARSLKDAREIDNKVKEEGIKFMVGHVLRFFPDYLRIKELVDSGEIGSPAVIRAFRGGPPISESEWFGDREKSGRVIVDTLIHDFDYLRWTIGEVDRVFTRGLSTEGEKDLALVILRFENGVIAHVEGSWAHPSSCSFATKFEISGTEGLIEYDSDNAVPLALFKEGISKVGAKLPSFLMGQNPWLAELELFLNYIKEDSEPRIGTKDAIEALRISLAALESLKRGIPIEASDFND